LDIFFLWTVSFGICRNAACEPFWTNGFINSDFFTPVTYLVHIYWPMILATIAANADGFLRKNPWERIVLPFKYNEILRIHIMILAMPFLAIITWALFKGAYQQLTIVLLIGIFYLLPKKRQKEEPVVKNESNQASAEKIRERADEN
jgi:hypothetical protein